MMSPVRFRIRTIMIIIAVVAVLLGLLRLAVQYDDTLTLALFIVLIGPFLTLLAEHHRENHDG